MKRKKKPVKKKPAKKAYLWKFFAEKLLQNVDALVFVSDARGRVVFANGRCLDFLKCAKKALVGRDWVRTMIPEARRPAIRKAFGSIKKKKTLTLFDTPVKAPGKGENYVCWASVPLKMGRGAVYMLIGREGKCPSTRVVRVHASTVRKIRESYRDVVEALFAASMISEPHTAEHAARVMLFSVLLAKEMGLDKERIERLKVASLLHDLGKLLVDEKILFKKGKLTVREFDQIKKHPHWGAEVVRLVYFLHDIIPIMASHHENYDGSGYPKGISGRRIPVEARILSVADIYEALTADRPYRKGYSKKEAVEIMKKERGRKLDPEITDVFLGMVKKNVFKWEDF